MSKVFPAVRPVHHKPLCKFDPLADVFVDQLCRYADECDEELGCLLKQAQRERDLGVAQRKLAILEKIRAVEPPKVGGI